MCVIQALEDTKELTTKLTGTCSSVWKRHQNLKDTLAKVMLNNTFFVLFNIYIVSDTYLNLVCNSFQMYTVHVFIIRKKKIVK